MKYHATNLLAFGLILCMASIAFADDKAKPKKGLDRSFRLPIMKAPLRVVLRNIERSANVKIEIVGSVKNAKEILETPISFGTSGISTEISTRAVLGIILLQVRLEFSEIGNRVLIHRTGGYLKKYDLSFFVDEVKDHREFMAILIKAITDADHFEPDSDRGGFDTGLSLVVSRKVIGDLFIASKSGEPLVILGSKEGFRQIDSFLNSFREAAAKYNREKTRKR